MTNVINYVDRWVGLSSNLKAYENFRELLIREQRLHNSDSQLATFVRERKLDWLDSVVESATLYERACNGVENERTYGRIEELKNRRGL